MAVAAVLKVVSALRFRELVEDAAAELPELVDGPFGSVAEQLLQLGECQLDRIQVGRVGRQVAQRHRDGLARWQAASVFRACSSARQALQIVIRQTSSPSSCFKSSCNSRRYLSGRAVSFA